MTPLLALLLACSIGCDIAAHLCFKHGAGLVARPRLGPAVLGFIAEAARQPVIWLGLTVATIELIIWLQILSQAPLSVVFPIISLNYCGVLIVSRFVLGERVAPRRWAATMLITAGVVMVGLSGAA